MGDVIKRFVVMGLLVAPMWAQQPDKGANVDLIAVRAANKEMRYTDAEALMLKDTALTPESSLMWIELGTAELGLKKYTEAETAFKKAIGIDPATQKIMHGEDFYTAEDSGSTHASRNVVGHTVPSNQKLSPEIVGAAYSSLGEIYARTKKTEQAQAAWDAAAKTNPAKAALYLGNETIIFYQEGNAEAQVSAAEKAIVADPSRAVLYYFKGQGLASKATVDAQTQRLIAPPGCLEAYKKYLELEPKGQFSAEAKEMIAAVASK
ncbi:MAG TPA: tetratricopeptide repeat protein [Edaphobacter sp.]